MIFSHPPAARAQSTVMMQCAQHGKELDFFCATCLVPACVSCVALSAGAHRHHETVEMEQVCVRACVGARVEALVSKYLFR